MAIATGNFPELLWPGIRDIWGTSYDDYEPLFESIFDMSTSNKAFEKVQQVTGLPLVQQKDQDDAIPYADPFQGLQKEFVNVTYALGTSVTEEMVEDEQYSYINRLPAMLARSMRQTRETMAFNHLNRAFNASYTGADGLSLCNASHTLVGGGTYSNVLSTSADLSQSSLEVATQEIMDYVDDRQFKIRAMPRCLVVPTSLNHLARKLLETDLVVGSADNDKNTTMGLFDKLVVSPWLTDTDGWFITTDVDMGLTWYDRRKAGIRRDNEFDTTKLKYATTARWSSGWIDPRGIFGSDGSGT